MSKIKKHKPTERLVDPDGNLLAYVYSIEVNDMSYVAIVSSGQICAPVAIAKTREVSRGEGGGN